MKRSLDKLNVKKETTSIAQISSFMPINVARKKAIF